MTEYIDHASACLELAKALSSSAAQGLKTLLQEKYLYQSVNLLDFPAAVKDLYDRIPGRGGPEQFFAKFARDLVAEGLILSQQPANSSADGVGIYPRPVLLLQNVKLFCPRCKTREAFSSTWAADATREIAKRHGADHRIAAHPCDLQVFALFYQCETCKAPVSFLVKRKGWKLTIEGRSPFEEADVPAFIPKTERWLFSDAIVAGQTGNTLAGIFYLRCFIEQFARRQTGIKGRQSGEEILDAYQTLLPEGKRDHMPSLRSWYEKLSMAIHAASRDDQLFQEARDAIKEHFDFRRIYKISDEVKEKAEPKKKSGE